VKLDSPRDYSPIWSGGDLLIELKEPKAVEAATKPAAAKPAAAKSPPAAAPKAMTASAGSAVWRLKGRLTDKAGKPLDGSHEVIFTLRSGDGAKELWKESVRVHAAGGIFTTALGKTRALPSSIAGTKLTSESPSGLAQELPYRVQTGAFPLEARAQALHKELAPKAGAVEVRKAKTRGKTVYRVLVGPLGDRASAESALEALESAGYAGFLLQE